MRTILLTLFAATLFVIADAQKSSYTPAEIRRIADLGRIWGMVNYFHPAMSTGKISTQDLVVRNAASLADNPSAENFKAVVTDMLGKLNDPSTTILPPKELTSRLNLQASQKAGLQKFSNGYWYVSNPTGSAQDSIVKTIAGVMPSGWDSAKGIILDIRNSTYNWYGDYRYRSNNWPIIAEALRGEELIPRYYEREINHYGFVAQEDGFNGMYSSGWRTVTNETQRARQDLIKTKKIVNKPVAIIINANTTIELLTDVLSLRRTGKCLLIFEGDPAAFMTGSVVRVRVADSMVFTLRTSDLIFGNNKSAPKPDLTIAAIDDFQESGSFMQQCFALLNKGLPVETAITDLLPMQYNIPLVNDTKTGFTVSTGDRLFALYNHWNAINYFFPYKHLLEKDWNKVLEEHVPSLIAAKDSLAYNFALRSMISEIHDSHGSLYNNVPGGPDRIAMGYWPPLRLEFINDRLYVLSIGKDSLQGKDIKVWDEVIRIDDLSVPQAVEKWKFYTAASSDETLKRDLRNVIIGGPLQSKIRLTIRRDTKLITTELTRSGRYQATAWPTNFNTQYPVLKMLKNNTGYVNMGALTGNMIDSMFTMFKDTRAIIFDIRNYPQGTAWSIVPRLAAITNTAVKFEIPLVTPAYITGGENKLTAVSYFTVEPDTTKPRYKGKVIMLCNINSQSQAEYNVMMFQGATKTTVIGSQTAGADGNVTTMILPGNYRTLFSGLNVLYPDGGQTQRKGIRIDIQSRPTIAGLKAGRDEVLERAMLFLDKGK